MIIQTYCSNVVIKLDLSLSDKMFQVKSQQISYEMKWAM